MRLKASALLLVWSLFFSASAFSANTSELCQDNALNVVNFDKQITMRPNESGEFTVLAWNVFKYKKENLFSDLKKLSETSDIMMLQEAMHTSEWQETFSQQMPFSFSFFKSFCNENNQATGVQNAARFKLMNDVILVSPGREPVLNTPKVSGVSRVDIPGHGSVLMVNIHAINFVSDSVFKDHISQVADYISTQPGPVIWAGDFNTWSPSRQRFLDAKTKALQLVHVNPVNDNRKQILDHIYVRGFDIVNAEVLNRTSSDHRPLMAVLKFIK